MPEGPRTRQAQFPRLCKVNAHLVTRCVAGVVQVIPPGRVAWDRPQKAPRHDLQQPRDSYHSKIVPQNVNSAKFLLVCKVRRPATCPPVAGLDATDGGTLGTRIGEALRPHAGRLRPERAATLLTDWV